MTLIKTFTYPAQLIADDQGRGYTVVFRDIPEAITQGVDKEDALAAAKNCLDVAIAMRLKARLDIPEPAQKLDGEVLISPNFGTCMKAAILLGMKEEGMTQKELSEALSVNERQVRRILDPTISTNLDTLEQALSVLEIELVLKFAKV